MSRSYSDDGSAGRSLLCTVNVYINSIVVSLLFDFFKLTTTVAKFAPWPVSSDKCVGFLTFYVDVEPPWLLRPSPAPPAVNNWIPAICIFRQLAFLAC